jgi:hypothetical protein
MKVSKCWEVGQTRRRRGISMKIRMKEEMLEDVSGCDMRYGFRREGWVDGQAEHTPEDDDVEVEDVCDSEGEAEDDAEDAGPGRVVLLALRRGLGALLSLPLPVYAWSR